MSATIGWEALHPLTLEDILATIMDCGCRFRDQEHTTINLCDYNEGFDDGIEKYVKNDDNAEEAPTHEN